ncbi:hypothetical protein HU200_061829 [Digitaria exilis]|uniref:Uncharacterized protein n=1 Tax=Digitaria exilis TaxID=1010633 RepID=A0A835AG66_9POAL|nr:hypothetical protein HU200_061829 [Digitaria exilis]
MKRHKTLSGKDGGQSDDILHQGEGSSRHLVSPESSKASIEAPAKNIKTFVVQCSRCKKWRLISTKAKYEEIRENILDDPFSCEKAQEWKPDVICDDPSDFSQKDGTKLWAIDKPNIPQSPSGWERFIKIRSKGCTQFADVLYKPPTGKMLRSLKEIETYLEKNPDINQGVKISQFSFEIPAPLNKDYVIRRSKKGLSDRVSPKLLQLEGVQPMDMVSASAMQGDQEDDYEDHPEVEQYEELQESDDEEPESPPPAASAV